MSNRLVFICFIGRHCLGAELELVARLDALGALSILLKWLQLNAGRCIPSQLIASSWMDVLQWAKQNQTKIGKKWRWWWISTMLMMATKEPADEWAVQFFIGQSAHVSVSSINGGESGLVNWKLTKGPNWRLFRSWGSAECVMNIH